VLPATLRTMPRAAHHRSAQGEGRFRTWAAGIVTAMALGCGGAPAGEMTADLERDLALATNASRPSNQVVSALEGGPRNAPSGTDRGRRDVVSRPQRAPRPKPQAPEQEVPALPTLEMAPTPAVVTTTTEIAPAPVPEPAPTIASNEPIGASGRGPSAGGGWDEGMGNRGRGVGGIIGVIIRGGAAGEDHCEIHDRRGRRTGRGLPLPIPGGIGGMGGIGGVIRGGGMGLPRR